MRQKLSVSFTDLLYGVVAGASVQRIENLELSQPNVLLAVAFIVLFDDHFLYYYDVESLTYSKRRQFILFWLDLLVLAVWYCVAVATKLDMATYMVALACFFFAASIWEFVVSKGTLLRRLLIATDIPLVIVCFVLAYLSSKFQPRYEYILGGFVVSFVLLRLPDWWSHISQDTFTTPEGDGTPIETADNKKANP